MNVIFDTADGVKIGASGLNDLVLEKGVEIGLHLGGDQPLVVFGVPGDVEVYFE